MEESTKRQTRSTKSTRGSASGRATTAVTPSLTTPLISSRAFFPQPPQASVPPTPFQLLPDVLKHKRAVTSASVTSAPTPSTSASVTSTPTPTTSRSIPTGLKKFSCVQCTYSTDRKNDLENHMNKHTGPKYKFSQYKKCKKEFTSTKALKLHVKTKHHKIPRYTHDFAPDGYEFTTNDYGKVAPHMKQVHDIGRMDFKCQNRRCQNRTFNNALVYSKHMKTFHLNEQCLLFRKWYKGGEYFQRYLTDSHYGVQFLCHLCGQVFPNYNSLKVHMSNAHRDQ